MGGDLTEARCLCETLLDDVYLGRTTVAVSAGPNVSLARPCFVEWGRYVPFVVRPALVARKDLARHINCPGTDLGNSVGLINDCLRFGIRIYATFRCGPGPDHGTTFGHTWDISNTEVLATSTISHGGPPYEMEMPTS